MCDLVRKSEGGGRVSSFERRGPLARGAMFLLSRGGVHWHGGSIGMGGGGGKQLSHNSNGCINTHQLQE